MNFLSTLALFAGTLILSAAPAAAAPAPPLALHVHPAGNDQWSGTLPTPNPSRSDGPLASLVGARNRLRAIRAQKAEPPGPVRVQVQGGSYRLEDPFILEPRDGGTAEAPVVYSAAAGQQPVFSGGETIRGWQQRGQVWETELPEVKAGRWYFRQLWVEGQRRQRARSPNGNSYHRIARLLPGPPIPNAKPVAREKFGFTPGDLQPWARLKDVNIVLMHSWETSIHPIQSVNTNTHVVHFTAPMKEWWSIGYWEDRQRYYVENARELLDHPGEWYLNRETGVLTYQPLPGERMDQVTVVAPRLTELARFAGDPDRDRWVRHVTLRGLSFQHSDWVLDPKGNSSTQAAVDVPAAIMADGALNCAIEWCAVARVGTYGIWLRRGCQDGRLQHNRLFDLGAGGIRVGEAAMARSDAAESTRNLVDNNHLFDGGHVFAAGVGIWVAQSSHNRITHNDVHDFRYSGMSIGWNWNDAPNRTHHNVIEFNHVHNLVQGVLSDAGLIYCLGVSPGSVIRNNIFHDIWPYTTPPFGWGIYLDATCGNYLVESNWVYNTRSGGLMFNNGGHEHLIRNNIFALSADYALWPYSEKRPSTFRHNIVYLTQGKLFVPYGERSLNERLAAVESLGDWDRNLYWHTGGADELQFYRRTFPEWQALGLDPHSRIADPLFENAAEHNFNLRPESPARELGFNPLNLETAGLYGDPAWVAEANHAQCAQHPLPPPPPPPEPLRLQDDFENTPPDTHPAHAQVSGEEHGASIRVTTERAAGGRRSLKITDRRALQPAWQPHFYYQPHITSGTVRQQFDLWLTPETQFFTEWRDNTAYPQNVGPSVRFDGSGQVTGAGKTLATLPLGQWIHVDIEAPVGKQAPRRFKLTLTPSSPPQPSASVKPLVFTDLPFGGNSFTELHWLGFSSTAAADTHFYLDNLGINTN